MKKRFILLLAITMMLATCLCTNSNTVHASTYSETEINDFIDHANSINFGDTITGTLDMHDIDGISDLENDNDFFVFTVLSEGKVHLSCDTTAYMVAVYLYTSDYYCLYADNIGEVEPNAEMYYINLDFELTPGTYYLDLSEYSEIQGSYQFQLTFTPTEVSFPKADSTSNSPFSIDLNTKYQGQIAISDYGDYYHFTVPTSGRYTLTINSDVSHLYVDVWDANNTTIALENYGWDSNTKKINGTLSLDLTEGDYYLLICGYHTTDTSYYGSYNFTIYSPGEYKPDVQTSTNNDSIDKADKICLNTTYTGELTETNTVDYYKFTMPALGWVALKTTTDMGAVYYRLFDSEGITRKSSDDQGNVGWDVQLGAGTYYFMVSRVDSDYIGEYSFIIKSNVECTEHKYRTSVDIATLTEDGNITSTCSVCGKVITETISHPTTFTLSKTSYTYTGEAKTPALTIKDANGDIIDPSNYTLVKDEGRCEVGTYNYTVTFNGNYSGEKVVSFTIVPKKATISSVDTGSESITIKASATASSLGAEGYQIAYKNIEDSSWTYITNTTTSKKITKLTPGACYSVKIRAFKNADGKTYYGSWSDVVTSDNVLCLSHTIKTTTIKATLTRDGSIVNQCSVCGYEDSTTFVHPSKYTLSYSTTAYTGNAKNPSLTITDANGDVIASSNYTVTKDAGRIEVGTYYYTVTFKGNYSGTKKVKLVINPAQAVIKSIGVGTNSLTVKASATAATLGADGYEVIYRKTGTTTWTHVTSTTTTIRLSDLPTGTQYQVRMRAYKVVNGTTYYGAWSSISYTPKVR